MIYLKMIWDFIKDPKNIRLIIFAGFVILLLLFLRQCNVTSKLKNQVKIEQEDKQRIKNNFEASQDSIRQYKSELFEVVAEKSGYEIKLDELKTDYKDLYALYEKEKHKKPTTIVHTEIEYRDNIVEIPVYIKEDINGTYLTFTDSVTYDKYNYRNLDGTIGFKIDTINKTLIPGNANLNLGIGMDLNIITFKDDKTKKITLQATTNYPGITFTNLNGGVIISDQMNNKELRSLRKQFSLGVSVGYGGMINMRKSNFGQFAHGPYIGIGLNWQPKFLQW